MLEPHNPYAARAARMPPPPPCVALPDSGGDSRPHASGAAFVVAA